jgi:hypothetical protein
MMTAGIPSRMNLVYQFSSKASLVDSQPLPAVQVGLAGKETDTSRDKTTECSDNQLNSEHSVQED